MLLVFCSSTEGGSTNNIRIYQRDLNFKSKWHIVIRESTRFVIVKDFQFSTTCAGEGETSGEKDDRGGGSHINRRGRRLGDEENDRGHTRR